MPRTNALLLALTLVAITAPALAQPQPRTVDLERWRASLDGDGFLGVEDTLVPGPWRWSLGLSIGHERQPLVISGAGETFDAVAHRTSATLLFEVGLGRRVVVGLEAPLSLEQAGDSARLGGGSLPSVAPGDAALSGKWRFLGHRYDQEREGQEGFGLAWLGRLSLPTGDDRAFLSEGTWTLSTGLAADLQLSILGFGATVGVRVRGEDATLLGTTISHALSFALAARIALPPWPRLSVFAELHAETGLNDPFAGPTSPLEAELGLRWKPRGDFVLALAGGLGLTDAIGTPSARVVASVYWAPRSHDRDGDGIPDEADACPPLAEDHDGFEDQDGCPDDDNDEDGVVDADDRCPTEVEDEDGFQDGDGCPDADNDGDGVPDGADHCPGQSEDVDGFEDHDGCVDPDNDDDGIGDAADRCRDEAEDRDGFEDQDGCPDLDDDSDGVPDSADRCARVAEDRDGFEDADGCPDPDNDHDGVLDAQDLCAAELETINGVSDDDGCPDTGGRALVVLPAAGARGYVRFAAPPLFTRSNAIDPRSVPAWTQLARHLRGPSHDRQVVLWPSWSWPPREDAAEAVRLSAVIDFMVAHGVERARLWVVLYETGTVRPRSRGLAVELPVEDQFGPTDPRFDPPLPAPSTPTPPAPPGDSP